MSEDRPQVVVHVTIGAKLMFLGLAAWAILGTLGFLIWRAV